MNPQPPRPHYPDLLDEAQVLDTPGGPRLRLRFSGPFEGRTVRWDASLLALCAPEFAQKALVGAEANFIEIGPDGPEGVPITVGLQVERIDAPTARKAMIMIRRYRRLRRGRIEYRSGGAPGIDRQDAAE